MFEPPVDLHEGDWLPPLDEVPDWLGMPSRDTWTDADALASAVGRPTGGPGVAG